jgi:hypothetical protein
LERAADDAEAVGLAGVAARGRAVSCAQPNSGAGAAAEHERADRWVDAMIRALLASESSGAVRE